MTISFLHITTRDNATISFPVFYVSFQQSMGDAKAFMPIRDRPYFFKISHPQMLTLINFTECSPYELWYFDAERTFLRKDFSLNPNAAPFMVQTNARYMAIVPFASKIDAELIAKQDKFLKFELTDSAIPIDEPYSKEVTAWTRQLFMLTNEELVQRFNDEVGNQGWVTSRGYFLRCLQNELFRRWPHCKTFYNIDKNGTISGLQLHTRVDVPSE